MTHDIGRIDLATQHSIRLVGAVVLAAVYLIASLLISVPLAALTLTSGLMLLAVLRPLHKSSRRSGERLRDTMGTLQSRFSCSRRQDGCGCRRRTTWS